MLKTLASIALGAALCLAPVLAVAQTGYGVKPGAPSTSSFRPVVEPRQRKQGSGESRGRNIAVNSVRTRAIIITPPITE